MMKKQNHEKDESNMPNDNVIEKNFEAMLTMLKKKVQEKDEEINRLQEQNAMLKEIFLKEQELVDETIKRR